MHECPECGRLCNCDGEDLFFECPYNFLIECHHKDFDECEISDEDFDEDYQNEVFPLDQDETK